MKFEYTDKVVDCIPPNENPFAEFLMGKHKPDHWATKKAMENPGVVFEAKGTENNCIYTIRYVYLKSLDTFYQYGTGLGVRCPGWVSHHIGGICSSCGQVD